MPSLPHLDPEVLGAQDAAHAPSILPSLSCCCPAQMPVCVTATHVDSLLMSVYSPQLLWDVPTLVHRAGL